METEELRESSIIILLDSSGSMERYSYSIRHALNDLIFNQKHIESSCLFTLITFSTVVKVPISTKNIKDVGFISMEQYAPAGSTALNDAIAYSTKFLSLNRKNLIIIITDGMENASLYTTKEQVATMIAKVIASGTTDIIYISDNIQVARQGAQFGLNGGDKVQNLVVNGGYNFATVIKENLCQYITEFRTAHVPDPMDELAGLLYKFTV